MFGLPIEKVELADVDAFCRSGVREGYILDFKVDFPARLEKTISSFANTYGGIILVGVDETQTGEAVLPIQGLPLVPGLRERVIQVAIDRIYPPVIPEVKVVEFRSQASNSVNDRAVVVIRVSESDHGPHAVENRTTVYLRTDNVSDPYRKATVEEVEWFSNKRQKAIDERNRLIESARAHANRYLIGLRARHAHPTTYPPSRFVFWTVPTFPRQPLVTPRELLNICREISLKSAVRYGEFPSGFPRPISDGIYFNDEQDMLFQFAEVHQEGLFYSEHGFPWDLNNSPYREWVYPSSVAEFLWAALAFGRKLYERLDYWGLVDFEFSLTGVSGRRIGSPSELFPREYRSLDDTICVRLTQPLSFLAENLVQLAKSLHGQILWAFGWDAPPETIDGHFSHLKL